MNLQNKMIEYNLECLNDLNSEELKSVLYSNSMPYKWKKSLKLRIALKIIEEHILLIGIIGVGAIVIDIIQNSMKVRGQGK